MMLLTFLSWTPGLLEMSMYPYDGDDCSLQAQELGHGEQGLSLLHSVYRQFDTIQGAFHVWLLPNQSGGVDGADQAVYGQMFCSVHQLSSVNILFFSLLPTPLPL